MDNNVMPTGKNYFETLNAINVNGKTETKNGLTYLSWCWAWGEVKKLFPDATYTVYENKDGWNYHTDGKTAWVKTGVTLNGIEHIEYLPVMDHRNKSIPLDSITSFDVNKAIQRSITKACARHGLGLYVYAGEDLPEEEALEAAKPKEYRCCDCGKLFEPYTSNKGKTFSAGQMFHMAEQANTDGKARCKSCSLKAGTRIEKPKAEQSETQEVVNG